MSSNTKKLIILVLAVIGVSVLMSAVCGISAFRVFRNRSGSGFSQTFDIKGNYSDIKIDTEISDIHLYRSEDRTAKAVWNGPSNMKLEIRTNGGTLTITEKNKYPWFLRIGINIITDTKLNVYLPKTEYDSLDVDSDTGSVSIPAAFSFEEVKIESDTGAVDFSAKAKDLLKIRTDTGAITVDNVSASDIDLKTATGRISMTDIKAVDLEAESDVGSITLTRVVASDEMKVKSDVGSITLDRCDAGSMELKSDVGSIRGTLLSDKVFTAKSNTGSINIPDSGIGGTCRIETAVGSIDIKIVGK